MKKPFCFLLYILFSCSLLAQEKSVEINDDNKFQFGITFSPEVAFRHLYKVEEHPFAQYNIDHRNANKLPKLGYSAGFHASYLMNRHFSVQIGFQYSNMGYQTKPLVLSSASVDPRRGFIYQGEPFELSYIYHFHYLEVPVQLNYRFGKGNWRGMLAAGVAPGYLAGTTRTKVENYDGKKERTNQGQLQLQYLQKYSLSPFITAGITYAINEQFTLQVTPTFRFNTLTVFDEPISTNLWNAGLQLGCFYSL